MRRVIFLAAMLGLAGCNEPTAVDDYPKGSCQNVDASIRHYPGVKPSAFLENVEKLACYYGATRMTLKDTCSIPVDSPDYYSQEDERSYGLKDTAAAQLVASFGYGGRISEDITFWEEAHRRDPLNDDRCLTAIHDIRPFYDAVDQATRGLRRAGY